MFKSKVWFCWLISLLFLFFTTGAARAEWIDDWFQQKVYTGPNHYKSSHPPGDTEPSGAHR